MKIFYDQALGCIENCNCYFKVYNRVKYMDPLQIQLQCN